MSTYRLQIFLVKYEYPRSLYEGQCIRGKFKKRVCKFGNMLLRSWSPYSCNDRKHSHKHVANSVPSNFDTSEHFDYNIASFTSIIINFSASSSCNDRSHHPRHVSKQLLTSFATHCTHEFFIGKLWL